MLNLNMRMKNLDRNFNMQEMLMDPTILKSKHQILDLIQMMATIYLTWVWN